MSSAIDREIRAQKAEEEPYNVHRDVEREAAADDPYWGWSRRARLIEEHNLDPSDYADLGRE